MTDDLKERKYLSERTGKKTSDSKQIEYQFCRNSNSSVLASIYQHYGLGVEYSNEEEVPNLLETPCFELISALPSGSHRKGFGGHRENRPVILLLELNRRIEEFNQKMEKFSEAVNKMWERDEKVVLVCRK